VGVVLRTAGCDEYELRRRGGNAFRDEVLERLVGTTITGLGIVTGRDYIMDEFTEAKGAQELRRSGPQARAGVVSSGGLTCRNVYSSARS
jgi:hypothetical protein